MIQTQRVSTSAISGLTGRILAVPTCVDAAGVTVVPYAAYLHGSSQNEGVSGYNTFTDRSGNGRTLGLGRTGNAGGGIQTTHWSGANNKSLLTSFTADALAAAGTANEFTAYAIVGAADDTANSSVSTENGSAPARQFSLQASSSFRCQAIHRDGSVSTVISLAGPTTGFTALDPFFHAMSVSISTGLVQAFIGYRGNIWHQVATTPKVGAGATIGGPNGLYVASRSTNNLGINQYATGMYDRYLKAGQLSQIYQQYRSYMAALGVTI
jgi:hypothetical protein